MRFGRQSGEVIARAPEADKMLWKEAKLWGQNLGEFHHWEAGERRSMRAGTSLRRLGEGGVRGGRGGGEGKGT